MRNASYKSGVEDNMRIRLSMGMMITAVLMWAATGDLFAETGSLQGRVTDSSGMAVAGATVALTAADGREMTHVLSGSNGEFSFPAVLGELRLEVNSAGFKSVKQIVRIGTGILVVPVVLERAASGAETTIGLESNNNLS